MTKRNTRSLGIDGIQMGDEKKGVCSLARCDRSLMFLFPYLPGGVLRLPFIIISTVYSLVVSIITFRTL